jgi:TetR/AcrR family transcriptional regulator, cholesterol catabolism regulator
MEIKKRIIEQSSSMFFRYGIRTITMDEVAESLGISKRTLYECFATKEDLVKECIEFQHSENLRMREEIMKDVGDDPLEVIHRHFRHAMIVFNSINPGFFNDLQKYHSQLWHKQMESKQQESIEFTRCIIEKAIRKGIFREEADPDILSKAMHTFFSYISKHDIFPETQYPRAEVFRQVTLNFIRGMATNKGIQIIDEKFK